MGKFKIENVIGAGIALLSMIMLTFLPLIKGYALFKLFGDFTGIALVWLFFPLVAVVSHLFGKVKILTAFLMLIPCLWGLVYVHYGVAGAGYWVYVGMTIILIVYTIIVKKKMAKQND